MKNLFTYFLMVMLLMTIPTLAQKKPQKKEVAEQESTFKRRDDEIRFQARNKIGKSLPDLLNTLTFDDLGEAERNKIILNSYLPLSPDQIFYNDNVIVEDDIDPNHISPDNAIDVGVDKYLRNLDLFYTKSDKVTITISQLVVSDVMQGDGYLFVKVYFTSTFTGKHKQIDIPYKPVKRLAELRAESVDNKKWRTYITRLAFLRSEDPPPPTTGPTTVFGRTDHIADSVAIRKNQKRLDIIRSSTPLLTVGSYYLDGKSYTNSDKASITFANNDQLFLYKQTVGNPIAFRQIKGGESSEGRSHPKLVAWLQIVTGVAALGASYAGYASLQSSYKDYNAKLATLNAEYSIYQSLAQQSTGNTSAATPMAFSSYASPGIYAVYGGGTLGTGLILNGIRQLVKKR